MRSAYKTPPEPSRLFQLSPADTALFLDFDGVIAEIVNDPGKVRVEHDVLRHLGELSHATGNAVAIVSGREIGQIDTFLSPLHLPIAGIHGLERRTAAGTLDRHGFDPAAFMRIRQLAAEFAESRDGVFAEIKYGSVALHYRHRPDLEEDCLRFADELKSCVDGLKNVRGKMVVEMKLTDRTKADAIDDFMREAPFTRRQPVFFGDDVTDEDGFRAVNALGGLSVKIGRGETAACERMASPAEFRRWLAATARAWRSSPGKVSELP